jgi:hypothetical protein
VDYPLSGYPQGYRADTNIIFIRRNRHGYRTIRVNGYPLTSLMRIILSYINIFSGRISINVRLVAHSFTSNTILTRCLDSPTVFIIINLGIWVAAPLSSSTIVTHLPSSGVVAPPSSRHFRPCSSDITPTSIDFRQQSGSGRWKLIGNSGT